MAGTGPGGGAGTGPGGGAGTGPGRLLFALLVVLALLIIGAFVL